ncbi:MOSC domain-containing protein [Pseudomonas marincola]|uniref:MOSC domain-containing protein n=1 Tax=Pseudomonas marincola TaxID=437900 RepID=UPI000B84BB8A|nr:MOSC domain-containing protein [Pseudomonas marincola]
MMRLSALYRYPMKSAAGQLLDSSRVGLLGLQGDRRWMAVDAESGRFLTQRLLAQMTQMNVHWRGEDGVLLTAPNMPELFVAVPTGEDALRGVTVWRDSFRVPDAGDEAAEWVSRFLGRDCRLVYVPEARARQVDSGYGEAGDKVGFADGFPLLLIGQSSLDDLSARVGRELPMLRFRPNLVITGAEPYAEDSWKRIRIGEIEFRVAKGCSRCIMTTLDPATGERSADREPLTTLKTYREREGEVYFGQNLIADGAGELQVGMAVEVLE